MSELYTVQEYTATVDQREHANVNVMEFPKLVDAELGKFATSLAAMNLEFVADPERGSRCRYPGILIWLNEVCGSQSLA